MQDGRLSRLMKSTNRTSTIHAICDYRKIEENIFPYMIFAYKTNESNTDGYTEVEVPAATWAIFKSRKHTQEETSAVMQDLIKRVYTDWLPTACYNKVDGHELELYFGTDDDLCYCETWIRVLPK